MELQRILTGPVAFDSETTFASPQHFVDGCSYTISLWAWFWPARNMDESVLRTRVLPDEQMPDKSRLLFPTVLINTPRHPDRFFFAIKLDNEGGPSGHYAMGANGKVPYMQWVHVAMSVSNDHFRAFINGTLALEAPRHNIAPGTCPYESLSSEGSSPSGYSSGADSGTKRGYLDSSLLEVFCRRGARSTVGIVQDVVVLRGMPAPLDARGEGDAALEEAEVALLMRRWSPQPSPTLDFLLHEHYQVNSTTPLHEVTANVPATNSGDAKDTTPSASGVSIAGGSETESTVATMDGVAHRREMYQRVILASFPPEAAALSTEPSGDGIDAAPRRSSKQKLQQQQEMARKRRFAAMSKYDDSQYVNGTLQRVNGTIEGGEDNVGLHLIELLDQLQKRLTELYRGVMQLASVADGGSSNSSAVNASSAIESDASETPMSTAAAAADKGTAGTGTGANQRPAQPRYFTGKALVDAVWFKRQLSSGSVPEHDRARVASMMADFDAKNRLISDQLYQSAQRWLSGRHSHMSDDASSLSLPQWHAMYYEMSRSALMLEMFVNDDHYFLHDEERVDIAWNWPMSTRRSLRSRLVLGHRAMYDSYRSVHVMSKAQLMDLLEQYGDDDTLRKQMQADVDAQMEELKEQYREDLRFELEAGLEEQLEVLRWGYGVGEGGNGVESLSPEDAEALKRDEDELRKQAEEHIAELQGQEVEWAVDPASGASLNNSITAVVNGAKAVRDTLLASMKTSGEGGDEGAVRAAAGATNLPLPLPPAVQAAAKAIDNPFSDSAGECTMALVYYLPLAEYSASHDALPATGVGHLERVRLSDGVRALVGHTGEDDELHVWKERDAFAGDTEADIWLARRYYYGFGGLERNTELALRHFRRAADRGNAEALYNLGVFYDHGEAGLERNPQLAFDYFMKAAHHHRAFSMAVEVVGKHHLGYNGLLPVDVDKAKFYYEHAANMHSPEGHFSLGMLYLEADLRTREGNAVKRAKGEAEDEIPEADVPQGLLHLAQAATWGHHRAMLVIAHAIFDNEGWLHQYLRRLEREAVLITHHQAVLDGDEEAIAAASTEVKQLYAAKKDDARRLHYEMALRRYIESGEVGDPPVPAPEDVGAKPKHKGRHKANERWAYKPGVPIEVTLPDASLSILLPSRPGEEVVVLNNNPNAAGAGGGASADCPPGSECYDTQQQSIPLPVQTMPLCEVGLFLAKHLAEMGPNTNGVMRKALDAYLAKDYNLALDYYDEAAELGVIIAHENAVFLYEKLMEETCSALPSDGEDEFTHGGGLKALQRWFEQVYNQVIAPMIPGAGRRKSLALAGFDMPRSGNNTDGSSAEGRKGSFRTARECRRYFQRVISRKHIYLSNLLDDPVATREIATKLLAYEYPFDEDSAAADEANQQLNIGAGAGAGAAAVGGRKERESPTTMASRDIQGSNTLRPTVEQAVRLYASNAVQGDVQSMVTLGWAFQSGSIPGIPKNLTAAKLVFASARAIEVSAREAEAFMGFSLEDDGLFGIGGGDDHKWWVSGGGAERPAGEMRAPPSTQGWAPLIGEVVVDAELAWERVQEYLRNTEGNVTDSASPERSTESTPQTSGGVGGGIYAWLGAGSGLLIGAGSTGAEEETHLDVILLTVLLCLLALAWQLRRNNQQHRP